MAGYLDYLDPTAFQTAVQQAQIQQRQQGLALTPKVNLGPVIRQAAATQNVQRALSMGQQRLRLARGAEQAARRQMPWTIGLGIADVGVGALSGYRALQQAKTEEGRQARMETQAQQGMQASRTLRQRLLEVFEQRKRTAQLPYTVPLGEQPVLPEF